MKILFVCAGNINRSPAAEIILSHLLASQGQAHTVASAGTSRKSNGVLMARKMRLALQRIGYEVPVKRSKPVTLELLRWADLVFYMNQANRTKLMELFGAAETSTAQCLAIYSGVASETSIPDPHFDNTGLQHIAVAKAIDRCCQNLYRDIANLPIQAG